jgi:hypothetical protein
MALHALPKRIPPSACGCSCSRIMWVLADVVGLFSINEGPFSRNVGRRQRIFSANVVPNRRMLSGPAVYVLGPPQISNADRRLLPPDMDEKQPGWK